jgi:aldehyde:ferredoxin oxidoreductase
MGLPILEVRLVGSIAGSILVVELSERRCTQYPVAEEVVFRFLSGLGLAIHLFASEEFSAGQASVPTTRLVLAAGALAQSGVPLADRFTVVARRPSARGPVFASGGGAVAGALKSQGFDAIVLGGSAARPAYLLVVQGSAEIREAPDLWGMSTRDTVAALRERHGAEAGVVCIGPAGERAAGLAGLADDRLRVCGPGLGAVLGGMGLKAICVATGVTRGPNAADPTRVRALSESFSARVRGGPSPSATGLRVEAALQRLLKVQRPLSPDSLRGAVQRKSAAGLLPWRVERGEIPLRNWTGFAERDLPAAMLVHFARDVAAALARTEAEGSAGNEKIQPSSAALAALGPLLLISDAAAIVRAHEDLVLAGLDPVATGVTLAWAMEAAEAGALPTNVLREVGLSWRQPEALVDAVHHIVEACREGTDDGLGGLLRHGSAHAATRIGKNAITWAMQVAGNELCPIDPRFDPGAAVSFQCDPGGFRNVLVSLSLLDLLELHRQGIDVAGRPFLRTRRGLANAGGKGRELARASVWMDLLSSAGLSDDAVVMGGGPPVVEWLNAATGLERSLEDWFVVGRRIRTLRRLLECRDGLTLDSCRLPERLRGVSTVGGGPLAGLVPHLDEFAWEYCEELGWDFQTGVPLRETVEGLGLYWAVLGAPDA